MTWFKVCDTFAFHRKAVHCSTGALGLWVVAGSWCAAQLTDGMVPADMVSVLRGTEELARELVQVGLWEEAEGGWMFHDWSDYQPTKKQRSDHRERMKKLASSGGKASGEKRRAKRAAEAPRFTVPLNHDAEAERGSAPLNRAAELSVPSRPVPSRPEPERERDARAPDGGPQVGSGLVSEDFAPTEETIAAVVMAGAPKPDAGHVAAFVNYHRSKGTVFADAQAAFRAWMVRERTFARPGTQKAASEAPGGRKAVTKRVWLDGKLQSVEVYE